MPRETEPSPLAAALRAQEPIANIRALLDGGADAQNIEVIQALEDFQQNGGHNHAWLNKIWCMPEFVQARQIRATADQAALDLQTALEDDDVDGATDAFSYMQDAGDGADLSIDDATFLCVAIQHKCSPVIIEMLIEGGGDPSDGCEDALEALQAMPDDEWKASVMRLPAFARALTVVKST
jgi:hypothetical protein